MSIRSAASLFLISALRFFPIDEYAQLILEICPLILAVSLFLQLTSESVEFPGCFAGGHCDDTPISQNKFVNFCFDPVHCKGNKTYTDLWVKAFYRFHQTNIAFLNQII